MQNDSPLKLEFLNGKNGQSWVVRATGPITLSNLFQFQSELRSHDDRKTMILDLCGVPYMDSAGMGAVVNFFTHCERVGHKLIVAGVSQRVLELFKMTRVNTIIPIVGSIEEAESRIG